MSTYKIRRVDFENPNTSIDYRFWTKGYVSKHDHAYHEIFVVCDDEIDYTLNGKNFKLYKGVISLVKIGDVHSFKPLKGGNAMHINVIFSDELLRLVSNEIDVKLYDKLISEHISFTLNKQEFDYISYTISVLNNTDRHSNEYFSELKILLTNFLNIINRNIVKLNFIYPAWFNDLILTVRKPSFISASVKDIYKASSYSEPITIDAFKKYTGLTPVKYLTQLKLNYACNMLKNTHKTTLEISQDIGYESLSHFNRIFKSHFNLTPKEFRNKK